MVGCIKINKPIKLFYITRNYLEKLVMFTKDHLLVCADKKSSNILNTNCSLGGGRNYFNRTLDTD